jgi:hypothetical protein
MDKPESCDRSELQNDHLEGRKGREKLKVVIRDLGSVIWAPLNQTDTTSALVLTVCRSPGEPPSLRTSAMV